MEKLLIQQKLLNDGLISLTPPLVERYNRCLERAGIPPTRRSTIQVDGVGWSPQVARERKDVLYLCNGVINPIGLIVSPEQYKKPVYFPLFSWQRSLMRLFFEKFHREIIDITATHAILIDMEDGLSAVSSPLELLLLSEITAIPDIGTLSKAAKDQAALIACFNEGLNCLEEEVCNDIINHRRMFGDLRKRQVNVAPVAFDLFKDFHTVAFNGAFVLRNVSGEDMLILENKETHDSLGGHAADSRLYSTDNQEHSPYKVLKSAQWLELPITGSRKDLHMLEEKKDLLLGWSLCDCEPGLKWAELTSSKRKSLMQSPEHRDKVPAIYYELERFAAELKANGKVTEISEDLWYYLAVPSQKLPPQTQEVLQILLTRQDPRNILGCYTYDKNRFLVEYRKWSAEKQEWAADYIAARYVARMHQ